MKHLLKLSTLALTVAAGGAAAQSIADQVIPQLQAQGYTRIEVKNGPNQVKVEAIRGNRELEVVYDARTGQVIKQEVNRVEAGDDTRPGIEVRNEGRDFVRSRDRDDDDDDDHRSGRDRDDDDDDDDRGGRDRDDDDDDRDGRDRDDDDDDDRKDRDLDDDDDDDDD